jgi:hypothetical protein
MPLENLLRGDKGRPNAICLQDDGQLGRLFLLRRNDSHPVLASGAAMFNVMTGKQWVAAHLLFEHLDGRIYYAFAIS